MAEGFQAWNEAGTLQFTTGGAINYALVGTYDVVTANALAPFTGNRLISFSSKYINYPLIYADDIVGIKIPSGYWIQPVYNVIFKNLYGTTYYPQYITNIPVSTTITAYIFRPIKAYTGISSGFGVELFDANSNLSWTSNMITANIAGVINDSTSSVSVSNGNNAILCDAVMGDTYTTNSSGVLQHNRARFSRSGNTFSLSWAGNVQENGPTGGYTPNLTFYDYRPSCVIIDAPVVSPVPGLEEPKANCSCLVFDIVSINELGTTALIKAGTSNVTVSITAYIRCTEIATAGEHTASITYQWQYRTIGGSWNNLGASETMTGTNTVEREPGTPDFVHYTDGSMNMTRTGTLTAGTTYEFRILATTVGQSGIPPSSSKPSARILTYPNDPSVIRDVQIFGSDLVEKTTTDFNSVYAAYIYGGVASSYSWSLSNTSGGSGTLSITPSNASSTTLAVSGLNPQATKTTTLNVSAVIDGYTRTSSLPITLKNTSTGATINPMTGDTTKAANSSSQSFTKTASVTNPYGAPVTYYWTITSSSGTWALTSGQGTANAVFTVTGAAVDTPYTCNVNCLVTVGETQAANVTGSLLYYNTASGVYISNLNPNGVSEQGYNASYSRSVNITVASSYPVTYSWSFPSNPGGWSMSGGSGSSVTISCSAAIKQTKTCTLRCTVTTNGTNYIKEASFSYYREDFS